MATQYMKKKKLYQFVCDFLKYDDICYMKYCGYKFGKGYEWLTLSTTDKTIKIGCRVYSSGKVWLHVTEYDDEDNIIIDEVYSGLSLDAV